MTSEASINRPRLPDAAREREPRESIPGDNGVQPARPLPGLYLHVPFCFHKCHYCDFYSIAEPKGLPSRHGLFVEQLAAEIERASRLYAPDPRTIFVGGGTPTLLDPDHWRRLLALLERLELKGPATELTVEANPETLTPALARVLASGGVTRISMGAQSFQPRLLATLERHHDPANVTRAVVVAREAGIPEVSLDLIFGIPGQTFAELDDDLERALAEEPQHVSAYALTYEPGTALTARRDRGLVSPLVDETVGRMLERVMDRLTAAGLEQYEISNWARPDPAGRTRRCEHNMIYWRGENYLGVGPSAASHVDGRRWRNAAHLGRYLASEDAPPVEHEEVLSREQRVGEAVMLGLRTRDGVSRSWLRASWADDDPRWQRLAALARAGLLAEDAGRIRLTRRGTLVADGVAAELI